MNEQAEKTTHQIKLFHNGNLFKWVRDDGEDVSPKFTTENCAMKYADVMPLITEDEWRSLSIDPALKCATREAVSSEPQSPGAVFLNESGY